MSMFGGKGLLAFPTLARFAIIALIILLIHALILKLQKNKRRKNMKKFFRQTIGCELNLGFLKFGYRGKVFHW
jgi:hypothetical protein